MRDYIDLKASKRNQSFTNEKIEYTSNKFNKCNSKTNLLTWLFDEFFLSYDKRFEMKRSRNGSTLTKNGHRLLRSFESFAYTIILSIL